MIECVNKEVHTLLPHEACFFGLIGILITGFQYNSLLLLCILFYAFKGIAPEARRIHDTEKVKRPCLEGSWAPRGERCFRNHGDDADSGGKPDPGEKVLEHEGATRQDES